MQLAPVLGIVSAGKRPVFHRPTFGESMLPPNAGATALTEEAQLLLLVAKQDRAAFARLFVIIAPKIKGYLVRLGAAPVSAEEMMQEVMLTIWRKADQFDPAKAGPLTWIFVITRNRRIDSLRRERAALTYGIAPPESVDDAPLACDALANAEREALLRRALADLPREQREVVLRSYFEEQPHALIAAEMGLPLGTVKSRLRLALTKLRAHLGDYND